MRDKSELLGMGDSPIVSQFRALSEAGTNVPPIYNEGQLVSENVWGWVLRTVVGTWTSLHDYKVYDDPVKGGIFTIPGDSEAAVNIAVLGDWASDTAESNLIAAQAKGNTEDEQKDYTIHLGDTYFVGKPEEIKANFFPEEGGAWPYGKTGSFALLGNHEMYSGGNSFFDDLLPRMGNTDGSQPQQASFFCLENQYWRIIGLDTGYDSLIQPQRLSQNANLKIPPQQIAWLHDVVKLNDDKRGLIFLSHHQCFSAFEQEFPNPLDTISTLMNPGRDVIWLWGHEHWMSVYGANSLHNGSRVFARCIGNSGMPVELDANGGVKRPKSNFPHAPENRNLVLFDQREREVIGDKIRLGHNGYVVLTLQGAQLSINYFDDNDGAGDGRQILGEVWKVDTGTGQITGQSIHDYTIVMGDMDLAGQLSTFLGAEPNDAVGLPRPA